MSAIEVHGLRVAAGGSIENGAFERLATDPTPIVPGRVWYNETEKVMKLSSLSATGAVIVEKFGTASELVAYITSNDAALGQEASDRASGDGALSGRLDVVEGTGAGSVSKALSDAQSYADTKIADLVDGAPALLDTLNELSAALANDASFATTVASDIAAAKAELVGTADSLNDTMGELSGRIDAAEASHTAELSAAVSTLNGADTALGGRIDTLETAVGGQTGDNVNLTTDAKLTLVAAINEVDANADSNAATISTLTGTVATNKGAIEGSLATEVQDRIDGDNAQATALNGYKTANDGALAAEVQARIDGDAAQGTALSGYVTSNNAEIVRVEGLVSAEATAARAAEATNATAISDEATAARAAEAAVQAALDAYKVSNDAAVAAEALARGNADTALGGRIDDVLSNLDPAALDSLTEIVAAMNSGDSDLQAAITTALGTHTSELAAAETRLDGEVARVEGLVTAEASTARTAEAANATAISAEETRAKAAEGVNATAITAEAGARTAADATLQGNIDTEAGTRAAADTTLQGNIDSEAATARAAEVALGGRVDAEETARANGDQAVRDSINGGRFTHQSASAGLVHTVSHGMNSGFIMFNVMVEGTDGVYRNDLAPVTETDNSTLKVELSNARNVKVTVIDMSAI